MPKLNERQRRFVREYLVDLNATQAAVRAGYAERTAYSQGQRLLKNVEVGKAIHRGMVRRAERTEVTQDRVVQELARIAFGQLSDQLSWGPGGVVVKDSSELTPEQVAAVAEVSEHVTQHGATLRVKLHDKVRALELLGRHLGMFPNRQEHSGPGGGPVQVERRLELSGCTHEEIQVLERLARKSVG